jgi:monofunctional biosynthetic peptidoglycan transglycosylase
MTADNSPAPVRRRSLGFRIARAVLLAVLALLLLPYIVTPFYRVIDPVSAPMLWRWLRGAPVERTFVPMGRIAPILAKSVIVSEDAKFCTHRGIDWGELKAAIEEADELGDMRGASTITQQTAKNLFFWGGRSFVRKALEFPLAIWIDLVLPKRRVLEIYLNIAQWGPGGQFGVEAGARRAFGKSARDVGPQEAAILAAVLPNPYRRNAQRPGPAVRRIAGRIQARAAGAPAGIDACVRAP